jgi:hypothetical protein
MTAVHSYDPETRTSANSPLPPRRHMAGNSPDAANTRESEAKDGQQPWRTILCHPCRAL